MNKQRGDSKLKTLPPDKQKQLYQWIWEGSYEYALELVKKEFGVDTNPNSLSEFFHWYSLGRKMDRADAYAEALAKKLGALQHLKLDGENLSLTAQSLFELQVTEENDPETFVALRKLRQNDRKLAQNDTRIAQLERKIVLLERQAEMLNKAKSVSSSTLSAEEKAAKIKEIFGTS